MARELGTSEVGTVFSYVKNVLNDRKPNRGPWILDPIKNHGALISRLDYGYLNSVPGVLHVKLRKEFFPYYIRNHGGHIMTAAGLKKIADNKYKGGFVDPYDEAYYAGGANTGGFNSVRIWRLFNATQANAGDMIF